MATTRPPVDEGTECERAFRSFEEKLSHHSKGRKASASMRTLGGYFHPDCAQSSALSTMVCAESVLSSAAFIRRRVIISPLPSLDLVAAVLPLETAGKTIEI